MSLIGKVNVKVNNLVTHVEPFCCPIFGRRLQGADFGVHQATPLALFRAWDWDLTNLTSATLSKPSRDLGLDAIEMGPETAQGP